MLGQSPLTMVGEEGLAQRLHHLLMTDPRQQFAQVSDPTAHRGDALGRELLGIRVEVVG
ncbi:hypothetical protein D3C84_1183690 [compost metagenome]